MIKAFWVNFLMISTLVFLSSACSSSVNAEKETLKADTREAVQAVRDTATLPSFLPLDKASRKAELMGKFDPSAHSDFVKLANDLTDGDGTYFVRKQTAAALERMITAAAADSIKLQVRSATRNFMRQGQIWSAKWTGERTLSNGINLGNRPEMSDSAKARMILLYSSMPGTSRHHWGTDVDFNAFENSYFEQGEGLEIYTWLVKHAASFGFYQPYTSKVNGRLGYEEEKWHWSFAPLSKPMLSAYRTEVLIRDISGFSGAESAAKVNAIEAYVLGINPQLL